MEPMPTTRRTACHNCATAKRRCIVNLPRCKRCAQKGIECCYDLEPLPRAHAATPIPRWQGVSTTSDVAIHCFLERVSTLDIQACDLSRLPLRKDPTGVAYILWALGLVPELTARGALSPFLHPKLRLLQNQNNVAGAIDAFRRPKGASPTDEPFLELTRADPTDALFEDILDVVQALMLYMIAFLLNRYTQGAAAAESWFAKLSELVAALEQHARDKKIEGLSPWHGWLLGESTRRTILTSHVFICLFCRGKYEVPSQKLHMESLPFDGRVGLWQAESPQAWISAARAKKGDDVQTKLVSFHEFGSSCPRLSFDADGDLFLAMMLVAHNGIDRVNEVYSDLILK